MKAMTHSNYQPSANAGIQHSALEQYFDNMRLCLGNRKRSKKHSCRSQAGESARRLSTFSWKVALNGAASVASAILAASFGRAEYQPVIFMLGWAFYCTFRYAITTMFGQGQHTEAQQSQPTNHSSNGGPVFRIALLVALFTSFALSIIFHRGFLFGAGIAQGWLMQSYWRQISLLGIHRRIWIAAHAVLHSLM
jgi:phage tail protein X